MADKNTIKNWFLTGLKPTQAQFWATWDSFWHKDEKIPITAIEDIENILNDKADADAFTNHLTDAQAHEELFGNKEDKNKKGVAGGYVPLDEFMKIATEYLSVVNDLVTGGADSILSAEQGKVLKNQIDGINALLASDNVNLDNVQELVDAIETVQTSLNTILVNDLTTGGITKALTAEMGKVIKNSLDNKANADGTILWHKDTKWFTPTSTVSNVGATVTSVGTHFTSEMVGAKLDINGEKRIITAYTSTTVVTVDSAYSVNNTGVVAGSWGVYSKLFESVAANGLSYCLMYLPNGIVQSSINTSGLGTPRLIFKYDGKMLWSNGTSYANTKDLAIRRNAAGLLEIYDGILDTGLLANRRDLLLRNLVASKITLPNEALVTVPVNGLIERDTNGELWETHNGTRSKLIVDDGLVIKLLVNFPPNGSLVNSSSISSTVSRVVGNIPIGTIKNNTFARVNIINTVSIDNTDGSANITPTSIKVEYFLRVNNGTWDSYIFNGNPQGTDMLIKSLTMTHNYKQTFSNQVIMFANGNTINWGYWCGMNIDGIAWNLINSSGTAQMLPVDASFSIVEKITYTYADATNANGLNIVNKRTSSVVDAFYIEKIR